MKLMTQVSTMPHESDMLHLCSVRSIPPFNGGHQLSGIAKAFGHPVP